MSSTSPSNGRPSDGTADRPRWDALLYPDAPSPGNGRGLREILSVLWEGKWIILITALTVLGSVAAYTYTRTPVYRASSTVSLTRSQSMVPGVSTTGRQVLSYLSNTLSGASPLQKEAFAINRSQEIRRRVAQALDSMTVNPHTGEPARLLFDAAGNRRSIEDIVAALKGVVQARPTGGGDGAAMALRLSVSSTSPAEAALLANQFAQAYKEWRRRQNRKATRSSRKFLEQQAKELRKRVRRAEERLANFMREEEGVRLDQRTSRAVQRIAELRARREELRVTLNMKRARLRQHEKELAQIRPRLAERLSSGVGAALTRVQKEKAEVTADISRIQSRYPALTANGDGPKARSLARLQRRKRRLESEADSLATVYIEEALAAEGIGAVGDGGVRGPQGLDRVVRKRDQIAQLQIEINGMEAKLQTLGEQIAKNQNRLDTLPTKQAQLAQIQRDRRAAEEIYSFVRKKLQEMRIAEESEGAFVEVLQRASVPGRPVSPNTTRNLQLGLLLGLVLGGGLAFLRERLDTRLRTPDDLEEQGVQMLGVVPSMAPLISEEFNGAGTVEIDGRSLKTTVAMLTAPSSPAAEAYRQLQVNLRYVRPDVPLQSVVVTSPEKGEGKTTTAVNLAVAAAQAGQQVVLVDADLRKPRLHKYLGLSATPGLTDTLYDDIAFTATNIDNLVFLPAGEEVPNPSELLGSDRTAHLIGVLEEEADLVIADTSPTLPFSDPSRLLPHTDGALLVAAANMTDARAYQRAYSRLEGVGPGVLGGILNQFDPERRAYDYYYGDYDYAYRYAEDEAPSRTFSIT